MHTLLLTLNNRSLMLVTVVVLLNARTVVQVASYIGAWPWSVEDVVYTSQGRSLPGSPSTQRQHLSCNVTHSFSFTPVYYPVSSHFSFPFIIIFLLLFFSVYYIFEAHFDLFVYLLALLILLKFQNISKIFQYIMIFLKSKPQSMFRKVFF